ncbi:CPBP family intramembrane metalloprotease [Bacillus albus]|nr:CPBP family intramembrane metalloprotease [Bacillus albus]RXJ23377.1 CPBP family intramembrane metalloprotease [Bacillus albus]RXJ23520.1 CPBP family intramembrane metalloprotease [Bacillus albus]RXJ35254.1 CPBP family intramembrane metalloprotease [Bacillus albus]RXJ50954.1 CPBP family intramembrane metalloprotease [Bacillus albus]
MFIGVVFLLKLFEYLFNITIYTQMNDSFIITLIFLIVFFLPTKARQYMLKKIHWSFFTDFKNYLYVFLGYIIVFVLSQIGGLIFIKNQTMDSETIQITSMYHIAIVILGVVVFTPFWEEMFFKRIVLDTLDCYIPFWLSVCMVSIIFASLHSIPMEYRIFPFILSVVTSFIYKKTNSLLAPFFIHCLWNLASII